MFIMMQHLGSSNSGIAFSLIYPRNRCSLEYHVHTLPETEALPRALGEAFAESCSQLRGIGKKFLGKGLFAESLLSGTRQSFCRAP